MWSHCNLNCNINCYTHEVFSGLGWFCPCQTLCSSLEHPLEGDMHNTVWRSRYKADTVTAAACCKEKRKQNTCQSRLDMCTVQIFNFRIWIFTWSNVFHTGSTSDWPAASQGSPQVSLLPGEQKHTFSWFLFGITSMLWFLWLHQNTVYLVLYLSLLTAHDELQHWHVVGPRVDLCQVVQVRSQRAQTPLD